MQVAKPKSKKAKIQKSRNKKTKKGSIACAGRRRWNSTVSSPHVSPQFLVGWPHSGQGYAPALGRLMQDKIRELDPLAIAVVSCESTITPPSTTCSPQLLLCSRLLWRMLPRPQKLIRPCHHLWRVAALSQNLPESPRIFRNLPFLLVGRSD